MSKHLMFTFELLVMAGVLLSACTQPKTLAQADTPTPQPFAVPTAKPSVLASPTAEPVPGPAWTLRTGAAIWGTPTVSNGIVYFGSDDGYVYAVDAQNGAEIWKFQTQGIVRSRPAVAGGVIYFASDDGNLYAVELGLAKLVWKTDIGNAMPHDKRVLLGTSTDPSGYDFIQSSPVVVEGRVYIGSIDGNIYSLAAGTGDISWTFKTGEKVRATPAIADGVVYIGSWDRSMYALDAKTGQVIWKSGVGGAVQSTALVANGLVYTASRKASVIALDAQTGHRKWEYLYGSNMWVESSPVLVDGAIYIGSSGSKIVLGIDSLTGKPNMYFSSPDFHWSTPALVNGMLYIGGTCFKTDENKGGLFGLELVNGKKSDPNKLDWFFPVPGMETAEGNWRGVASSPVIDNGFLYFGGLDGVFYAIKL